MAAAVATAAEGSFDLFSLDHLGGRLNEVLANHSDRLTQWRRERSQALHQEGHQVLRDFKAERRELDVLQGSARESAKLQGDAIKANARGEKLVRAVHEGLEAMSKRSEAAAQARDRFVDLEQRRVEELRREEEAHTERCGTAARRLAEVDHFLELFQERLGLELTRTAPQTVRFAFTLLDEADSSREFSFVLAAPDGGEYEVSDCTPALPPRRLAALVARLNGGRPEAASALPVFVCCMRRAFEELVR